MLVGQGGDKKPATPTPPPAATAPAASASSSCCNADPCGCEGFGHRLRDRMRGLFNRNNCDSCQPVQATHTHFARNSCDTCAPKIFNWTPRCTTHNACAPATCNDSCGHSHGGLFDRLRGSFARGGSSCCDGGCGSVTTPATTTTPAKSGEPITNPPKKLPVEKAPVKAPEKAPGQVGIGSPLVPATPNTISVTPSIPSVELAPVPAPRVEGDRRDPF